MLWKTQNMKQKQAYADIWHPSQKAQLMRIKKAPVTNYLLSFFVSKLLQSQYHYSRTFIKYVSMNIEINNIHLLPFPLQDLFKANLNKTIRTFTDIVLVYLLLTLSMSFLWKAVLTITTCFA